MLFGPDAFGYFADAVGFEFEDIRSTGQAVLTNVDDGAFELTAAALDGFAFDFYGTTYTDDLFFSSNGLITFGSGSTAFTNQDFTSSPTQAAIAPLWDDLVTTGAADAVYWEVRGAGDDQRLVLQWNDVSYIGSPDTDLITFQAVLFERGGDIRFNYLDVSDEIGSQGDAQSATVGVKDAGPQAVGAFQLVPSFNAGPNEFVGSGQSTLISLGSFDPELSAFEPVGPQGGLVYEATASGRIESVGDVDTVTADLAAGHSLLVLAESPDGLPLSVTVLDPSGNQVVPPLNGAAPLAESGTYTVSVSGGPGVGRYDLQLLLNTVQELEITPGDDAPEGALPLAPTAPPSGLPGAERAAVRGRLGSTSTTVFFDDFESGGFRPELWASAITNATVDGVGLNEPSGQLAARFNRGLGAPDELLSVPVDLSAAPEAELVYSFQRRGGGESPDTRDDLVFEYRNNQAQFVELDRQLGSGPDTAVFERVVLALPPDALHEFFQLRVRSIGTAPGSGDETFDDWFVDDVSLVSRTPDAEDWYRLDLDEGGSATATLNTLGAAAGTLSLDVFVDTPPPLAGDFNRSGVVNAADFTTLRDLAGHGVTLAGDETPGAVGGDDFGLFTSWFNAARESGPLRLEQLAAGVAADGVDQLIRDFVETTDLPGASYYLRVAGGEAEYQLVVTRGAGLDAATDDSPPGALLQELPSSGVVFGAAGDGPPTPPSEGPAEDTYRFNAVAGDLVSFATATPIDGGGGFGNGLDPLIVVTGPDGEPIAAVDDAAVDGRNAFFSLVAPLTGAYTVQLLTADAVGGDYQLSVSGFTGPGSGFSVEAVSPVDGARLRSVPTLELRFNDQVDLTSLEPGDVLVDGAPVQGVEVVDGAALRLLLPPLPDGEHTVTIAAGALTDLQGTPIAPFLSTFETDATGPRVVASSLLAGQVVPEGALSVALVFDETLDDTQLGPEDVVLVGAATGLYAPGAFDYNPGPSTLAFVFDGLPEDDYTLILPSGAYVDGFGNALDGEPGPLGGAPTGDGLPGGDFVVSFTVDRTTAPIGPFERLEPLGGLASVSENPGLLSFAADVDDLTVTLAAGETISAVLTADDPAAAPSLLVNGTTAFSLAGPGEQAALRFTAPAAGDYTLRVGAEGVTGPTAYRLSVFKDTLVELVGGDTGDGAELSLDPSRIAPSVVDPTDGRFAVLGNAGVAPAAVGQQLIVNGGFETGDFTGWSFDTTGNGEWVVNDGGFDPGSPRGPLPPIAGSFDATLTQSGPGVRTLWQTVTVPEDLTSAVLSWSDRIDNFAGQFVDPDQEWRVLVRDAQGATVAEVFSTNPGDPDQQTGPNARSFDITAALLPLAGGEAQIAFQEEDNLFFLTTVVDEVRLDVGVGEAPGAGVDIDVDEYELSLGVGRPIDIVLAGQGGVDFSGQSLELLRPDGRLLFEALPGPLSPDATNFDLGLLNLTTPEEGVYTLRVTSTIPGDYGLVVTEGVRFEAEPNDVLDPATPLRQLNGAAQAIGYLEAPAPAATAPASFAPFGPYLLPKDADGDDHGHDHGLGDGVAFVSAAATAFLPVGKTPAGLAATLAARPPADIAATADGLVRLIAVSESEDNDTIATADAVPLGFDPGEDAEIDLTGVLAPPPAPVILFPTEDDGSIGLATLTPLLADGTVVASAQIGDGPFGATSGDYDFYAVAGVAAGETLSIDIDAQAIGSPLDPFVAVYDAAGNLLAFNDDADGLDSFLLFTAPEAGDYFVSVFAFGGAFLADPFDPSSGVGAQSTGAYDLTIGLDAGDVDFFAVELNPGDILGAGVTGGASRLSFRGPGGEELIGSSQDLTGIHPASSPLPGGNAALSWVVDTAGTYYVGVSGGAGAYEANLRLFRPVLEAEPLGTSQILFLDFDGATIDTSIFGGPGEATLSPLADFLPAWGLDPQDDLDAVIDAIVASVEESLSEDVRARGLNGDFAATGVGGQFDLQILNSRDHADRFGAAHVSRVIVGGTVEEAGISTIGIAQSIDVGNFETEESALVLLDLLSAPATDPNSLNQFTLDPSVSIIDLLGVGLGNITAHEAGHFLGNWHTNQFNSPPNIMDQGGNLPNFVGLVGPVWGDGDEIDVDLGDDQFVPNEGFTGVEDTLNTIAFGLSSGGFDPGTIGPAVVAVDPPAGPVNDLGITEITVGFSEPISLAAAVADDFRLIAAGPNGVFQGGAGDDQTLVLLPSLGADGRTLTLDFPSLTTLPLGSYRLTLGEGIEDLDGNPLNATAGPGTGSPFVHEFDVVFDLEPGGDLFELIAFQNDPVTLRTETPEGAAANTLVPRLVVIGPSGLPVAGLEAATVDGRNLEVRFLPQETGVHFVQVLSDSGRGEYVLSVRLGPDPLPSPAPATLASPALASPTLAPAVATLPGSPFELALEPPAVGAEGTVLGPPRGLPPAPDGGVTDELALLLAFATPAESVDAAFAEGGLAEGDDPFGLLAAANELFAEPFAEPFDEEQQLDEQLALLRSV